MYVYRVSVNVLSGPVESLSFQKNRTCIRVCVCVCACVCVRACVCVCVYTYIHVHVHLYTLTYKYTVFLYAYIQSVGQGVGRARRITLVAEESQLRTDRVGEPTGAAAHVYFCPRPARQPKVWVGRRMGGWVGGWGVHGCVSMCVCVYACVCVPPMYISVLDQHGNKRCVSVRAYVRACVRECA